MDWPVEPKPLRDTVLLPEPVPGLVLVPPEPIPELLGRASTLALASVPDVRLTTVPAPVE